MCIRDRYDTAYLTATVVPSNATNKGIVWSSSNTSVVTVGSTGLICARAPGTATITARSSDNSAKYATCVVRVKPKTSYGNYKVVSGWDYQTYDVNIEDAKVKSGNSYCTEYFSIARLDSNYQRALVQANWAWTMGYSDAGKHLKHFLCEKGKALNIDVKRMIDEAEIGEYCLKRNLDEFMTSCEYIVENNGHAILGAIAPIRTMISPEDPTYPDDLAYNKNWWYAVGNTSGYIVAECSNNSEIYTAYIKYYVRDFYDWVIDSPLRGGIVTDGEMSELHRNSNRTSSVVEPATYQNCKEYEISGVYAIKLTWSKGQRTETGAVITEW